MGLKLIASWQTLFQKAGAVGKARTAYSLWPTPETAQSLNDAVADHGAYRDICLMADEMVGLDLPVRRRQPRSGVSSEDQP